jgi:uncharacterized protein YebE (UPF0316 family)
MPAIDWSVLHPAAVPLLLFGLRAADLTLATLRTLAITRGRSALAWVLGFTESGLFLIGAVGLIATLSEPLNLLAYAAGFATGNVIGLILEGRVLPSHALLRIYSPARASVVVDSLHREGWGATEVFAKGLGGTVGLVLCFAPRRDATRLRDRVIALDPEAVITLQNVRSLLGGWRP